jgi:hypothetical protein
MNNFIYETIVPLQTASFKERQILLRYEVVIFRQLSSHISENIVSQMDFKQIPNSYCHKKDSSGRRVNRSADDICI